MEQEALRSLGDRTSTAKLAIREVELSGGAYSLALEMKAVEALKTQLGLIQHQINHIEGCLKTKDKES